MGAAFQPRSVQSGQEKIAVAEASNLGIPIIAIIDTNADPDPIDFPIAGNDDAIKSIRVLLSQLVDAAIDARGQVSEVDIEDNVDAERQAPLETYTSEVPKEEVKTETTEKGNDTESK